MTTREALVLMHFFAAAQVEAADLHLETDYPFASEQDKQRLLFARDLIVEQLRLLARQIEGT